MNEIGFTGTQRGMTVPQELAVTQLLRQLFKGPSASFHNGMCHGADESAARIAGNIGYRLIGYPGETSLINGSKIVHHEVRQPAGNLIRNRHIVNAVKVMIAAPFGDGETLRSGTWATVRYAKKMGTPLFIVWPSGSYDTVSIDMEVADL